MIYMSLGNLRPEVILVDLREKLGVIWQISNLLVAEESGILAL